jgi:type IV secretory pathway ATPase VirB11/archaellum biosynthesis ATPase
MPPMTPGQLRTRQRVETVIKLASPVLDLVLAAGDRVSRIVEPTDVEYYPPRISHEDPPPRISSSRKQES